MCSAWFFRLILEEFRFQYDQPLYVSFLILSHKGRNAGRVALEGSAKQAEVDVSMSASLLPHHRSRNEHFPCFG